MKSILLLFFTSVLLFSAPEKNSKQNGLILLKAGVPYTCIIENNKIEKGLLIKNKIIKNAQEKNGKFYTEDCVYN